MKRLRPFQIFALLVTAALCIAITACGSSKSSEKNGASSTTSASGTGLEKTSLNALLKGNKNVKCTYSSTDPDTHATSSGTFYIAGPRMRGDFTSQDPTSGTTSMSTLRDNTWEYLWQTGSDTGTKIKVSDAEATTTTLKGTTTTTVREATTTTTETPAEQDNTQYDYNCSKWTVDESVLTPPANVNFVDYSTQLEQQRAQASQAAQEGCNAIDDADLRAQCLSSINRQESP